MNRTISKIMRGLAPALVAAAIVAPGASAMPADVVAPAAAPAVDIASADLRSPDARDAGRTIVPAAAVEIASADLRSPDARDAGRTFGAAPEPIQVISRSTDDGFQWGDAAIGAAGMLTLALLGLGLVAVAGQRRRTGRATAIAH